MTPKTALMLTLVLTAAACPEEEAETTATPHSLGLGAPCQREDELLEPCKEELWCAGWNSCGAGYCMQKCDSQADCTEIDGITPSCGPWTSFTPDVCRYHCQDNPCPMSFTQDLVCASNSCKPLESACEE